MRRPTDGDRVLAGSTAPDAGVVVVVTVSLGWLCESDMRPEAD